MNCLFCNSKLNIAFCLQCKINVFFESSSTPQSAVIQSNNWKDILLYFSIKDSSFELIDSNNDNHIPIKFTLNNFNINSLNNYMKNYFLLL